MASFGGFIASALGGAAKGYGEGAQMEMKKQAELDLKKQMLDAEAEKDLRVADINRQRINDARLADEKRVQSPDYLKAQAQAEVEKVKALMASGLSEEKAKLFVKEEQDKLKGKTTLLADQAAFDLAAAQSNETSQADLRRIAEREAIAASASKNRVTTATAGDTAAAASTVILEAAKADAKSAPELIKAFKEKYDASKEFEKLKAGDATTAQIDKAKALVADSKYMEALEKTDLATHAGVIRVAQLNKESAKDVAQIRADSSDERTAAQLKAAELKAEEARLKREAEANKPSKGPGGSANVGLELERAEKSAKEALARALGVETKEANGAYATLKRRADSGDAAAKAKLAEVTPMKNRLEAASAEWEARKKATGAAPAAAAPGAEPPMPRGFK